MTLDQFLNPTSNKETFSLLDMEEIFLGAIIGGIIDHDDIFKVKSEYFAHNETKKVFDITYKVVSNNGYVDFILIQSELAVLLGQEETKKYLDRIVTKVPEGLISSTVINELEIRYIRRESLLLIDNTRRLISESPAHTEEYVLKLHDKISTLVSIQSDYDFQKEISAETDLISSGNQDPATIKTGLNVIDKTIGGISTSEITIIGGRPGHGKTDVAIILSLSITEADPNTKVAFFSLEMSKSQLYRRYIASIAGVSSYKIRINDLSQEEIKKIGEANAIFGKYKDRLYIYDDVYDLITMKKICKSIGANIAIVDFITLMDGVSDDKRNQLGDLAKSAKRFAKSYNMGWIFLSQLSRDVERRETHRPEAGDVAESDQLTQLAGDIILLYYPFVYSKGKDEYNRLLFIFGKTRHAKFDDRRVFFDPDLIQIKDKV